MSGHKLTLAGLKQPREGSALGVDGEGNEVCVSAQTHSEVITLNPSLCRAPAQGNNNPDSQILSWV